MEYQPASFEFYRNQIISTAEALFCNDIQILGTAVFSFFEGKQHIIGKIGQVSGKHIESMFLNEQLIAWSDRNPQIVLRWLEGMFFYFKTMAVIPEVATDIWPYAAAIANKYQNYDCEYLGVLSQIALWAFSYKNDKYLECLEHIKTLKLSSKKARALRSLFLSTSINENIIDRNKNIINTYKNRSQLTHKNLAIAIINYYCNISKNENTLDELIKFLNGPTLKKRLNLESTDFLKPLIWELFDKTKYDLLLKFLRSLKNKSYDGGPFSSAHAFLLCNSENLVIQTKNWKDTFETSGNYTSYKNLIEQTNKATNTFISLLGESTNTSMLFDYRRKGAPPINDNLESLASATISHLCLKDPIYSEINLLTLTPSHNFPVQSCLFKLGKAAPVISTSLEDLVEEPQTKKFTFFLSSLVSAMPIELEFIKLEFGECSNIILDPSPEEFELAINLEQYNTFYISCHGEYNHWGNGSEDKIVFSESSEITIQTINKCSTRHKEKRNIILNICDGATSTISCIPYNRGMAPAFARGHQTVISHLWPVSSVYACAFGLLNLYFLKSMTAIDAARETFDILNSDAPVILRKIRSLSPSFEVLANYLSKADFNMKDFKNIGSVAIYS